MQQIIDLRHLGFDRGAHILVQRALAALPIGGRLAVAGTDAALKLHLTGWCRERGHVFEAPDADGTVVATIVRGGFDEARWHDAERAGDSTHHDLRERAEASWGLAARGALVESGGLDPGFDLDAKPMVWTDLAPRLYAQAAAGQWDPSTAIYWSAGEALPDEIEATIVQVLTYLVENEQAALTVPARFLGRIHPYYRETVQFLATQVADEARHVEVFARRAAMHPEHVGRSSAGSRASLGTLLSEPDFALASFLLSVLGEGTFLNLLGFIERFAPDSIVRQSTRLVLQDEARHVAFAMGHLEYQLAVEPELKTRLRTAIERRYEALRTTAGLGEDVLDGLAALAAGSWQPEAIASGYDAVQVLQKDMAEGRERRLMRLGFTSSEAGALSSLHTRNFM